jgi:hypothetical protein
MKSLFFLSFLIYFTEPAMAFSPESKAVIYSIDDHDIPYNYVEVSEEGLPSDLYQKLLRQTEFFRFTPITEERVKELFSMLKRDSRARMRFPGGLCTRRRIHIQNFLRGKNIVSGKLFMNCPGNQGRLRLRDQVSGKYFTYSNFHDTNVVLVKTATGNALRVLDLQFQSSPVSLNNYLAQIETFQRIQPAQRSYIKAGTCYWSVR